MEAPVQTARILIVDDQPPNVLLLERILQQAGYANLRGITDPREVLAACAELEPDLVILDLLMPDLDGFAVMQQLREHRPPDGYLPILVVTADVTLETRRRALAEGATDFLTKPVDVVEVQLRTRNLLETRALYRQISHHNRLLEATVHQRTRELREANDALHVLIHASPLAILTLDPAGLITSWSPAAERTFGWAETEVLGRPNPTVPERSYEHDSRVFRRVLAGEAITGLEVLAQKKDGTLIEVSVSPAPLRDADGGIVGIMSVIEDITGRKRTEWALRRRLEMERMVATLSTQLVNVSPTDLDQAIDSALETIRRFTDADRSYIFLLSSDSATVERTYEWCADGIERRAARLTGVPVERFPWWTERLTRLETIHVARVADLPPEAGAEKALLEGEGIRSIVAVPMVAEAKAIGFLGFDSLSVEKSWPDEDVLVLHLVAEILTNALIRHRRDEERTRLLEEIGKLEAQQEMERLKGEFVSIVSHEFRTPLSTIVGFAELLLTRELAPEQQRQWIEIIHSAGQRLNHLVGDVLNVSRIETGRVELLLQPVDVSLAAQEALTPFAVQATSHQFQLQLEDPLLPALADQDKLMQILNNLVSNAVKYSPDGGPITVSIGARADAVHLSVADEGLGIPAEELPNLFGRFHRIRDQSRQHIPGTGLGLYIAKRLVDLQGGRIWAESPGPGRGSTFHVVLPVAAEGIPAAAG